jgi:membrane protease YdiL (CAAX protease family)
MKAGINSVFKCLIYFFSILIIQMLVSLAFAIPVIVKNQGFDASSMNTVISEASIHTILFTNMAAYILFVAIACFITKIQKRKISQQISFYKVPLKACIFPILTAFSFSMFWNIFVEKLISLPVDIEDSLDNYNIMINESKDYFSTLFPAGGTIMFVLSIIIIAPIAEEFIFRGLIQTKLRSSMSSILAICISATFFGIFHIMASPIFVLSAFFMGIILAYSYEKTNSLLPPVMAHIAANLAGIAVNVCNGFNNWGLWTCTILFAGLTILGWFGIRNQKLINTEIKAI